MKRISITIPKSLHDQYQKLKEEINISRITRHALQSEIAKYDEASSDPIIKIGQIWFVKFQQGGTLAKYKITDLTEKTVELISHCLRAKERYDRRDIYFIERATDG